MEQFSICSNDSIWEDEERRNEYIESKLNSNRNGENASQPMYFNNFIRFDQNSHVKPAYNKNYNTFKKTELLSQSADDKSGGTNHPNEECYQVRKI